MTALMMVIFRKSGFWFRWVGYLVDVVGTALVASVLDSLYFSRALPTMLVFELFHACCLAFRSPDIMTFIAEFGIFSISIV